MFKRDRLWAVERHPLMFGYRQIFYSPPPSPSPPPWPWSIQIIEMSWTLYRTSNNMFAPGLCCSHRWENTLKFDKFQLPRHIWVWLIDCCRLTVADWLLEQVNQPPTQPSKRVGLAGAGLNNKLISSHHIHSEQNTLKLDKFQLPRHIHSEH